MNRISTSVLSSIEGRLQRGESVLSIQRNPTDYRIYPEYGSLDIRRRSVDQLVSDYCSERFDLVFHIGRNEIKLSRPDMMDRLPDLWASSRPTSLSIDPTDEFVMIAVEEEKKAGPTLPKLLDDQIWYLLELCNRQEPTVAVLFIDSEYIFPKTLDNSITANMIRLFRTVQRGNHLICFLTQNIKKLHPAMRESNNVSSIQVPPLSRDDYKNILESLRNYFPTVLKRDALEKLSEDLVKKGISCAELEKLCERADNERKKLTDFLNQKDWMYAEKLANAGSIFTIILDVKETLEDIAGLEELKQVLYDLVILPYKSPETFQMLNAQKGGAILMYGPPGTGKTLSARAIAGELDVPFIGVKASDILNKWLGESEAQIRRLFEIARSFETCVIFIDEIDGIFGRSDEGRDIIAGIRSEFLSQMDGVEKHKQKPIIIAATNHPLKLDPAMVRPGGRIHPHVYVGLPDVQGRTQVFKLQMKGVPVKEPCDYRKLAEGLEHYSGADIHAICEHVKRIAGREAIEQGRPGNPFVEPRHFTEAIAQSTPSTRVESLQECYEFMRGPSRERKVNLNLLTRDKLPDLPIGNQGAKIRNHWKYKNKGGEMNL